MEKRELKASEWLGRGPRLVPVLVLVVVTVPVLRAGVKKKDKGANAGERVGVVGLGLGVRRGLYARPRHGRGAEWIKWEN